MAEAGASCGLTPLFPPTGSGVKIFHLANHMKSHPQPYSLTGSSLDANNGSVQRSPSSIRGLENAVSWYYFLYISDDGQCCPKPMFDQDQGPCSRYRTRWSDRCHIACDQAVIAILVLSSLRFRRSNGSEGCCWLALASTFAWALGEIIP